MRRLRHALEYGLLRAALAFFGALPAPAASNAGGALMRALGPRMGISRTARRNIASCFPSWSDDQINRTLAAMWENLGRIIAEYPHLETIARAHVTFSDPAALDRLRLAGGPVIFVSGHLGNWEVLPPALLAGAGITMHSVYRAPNNPRVDRLLVRLRSFGGVLRSFGKNRKGLAETLRALGEGACVGMLIDQKMNTGIETRFFGMPAMTSTAFVELARKLNCPVVPGRIVRLGKSCRFVVETAPPLALEGVDTRVAVDAMQALLERWIREYPAQWLWVHRRWKKQ